MAGPLILKITFVHERKATDFYLTFYDDLKVIFILAKGHKVFEGR